MLQEVINDLYRSLTNVGKLEWVAGMGDTRDAYRLLVRKRLEKRTLLRPRQ